MPPIRKTGAMIGRTVKSNLFFLLTRRDRCQDEPRAWLRSIFSVQRPAYASVEGARHPSLEGAGRFSPRMLIRHPSVPADLTMSALGPVVKPTMLQGEPAVSSAKRTIHLRLSDIRANGISPLSLFPSVHPKTHFNRVGPFGFPRRKWGTNPSDLRVFFSPQLALRPESLEARCS